MALSDARLSELYNRCNPFTPMPPDDGRNVDVDMDFPGARGGPWAKRLATKIRRSGDEPATLFFTGLPGSGKSTELLRLATLLGQDYLPVVIDGSNRLDLSSTISIAEVLTVILYEVELAVLALEGRAADEALRDGVFRSLFNYLTNTEVEPPRAEAGVGGAKAIVELKTQPTTREQVRKKVESHVSEFLSKVHGELKKLDERARKKRASGIVVVFDSLEKVQGIPEHEARIFESLERLFGGGAQFVRLPVHALYTVPPGLALRLRLDVSYLPMLKIRTRDGRPERAGMDAAIAIATRRVPEGDLKEILGDPWGTELEDIVRASGGYPREILRLLQALLEHESFPVSKKDLVRTLSRNGRTYREIALASGALPFLARVQREKQLRLDSEEETTTAVRMFRDNVILRYCNDEDWVELHPAVRELPEIQTLLATPERGTDGPASGPAK